MKRNGKAKWRVALIGTGVLLALLIGCGFYLGTYYHASEEALAILADERITVENRSGERIAYVPPEPMAGFIFYPGGKVQYESYAPLMEKCAENGILSIVLHMPGNLAVLDRNAADGIREAYPEISRWFIGGHSLGGVVAASYAADHMDAFEGLILLASYSTEDLRSSGLWALSVVGTEDGVLDAEKYAEARANLPEDREEILIDGGCHAYFGSYGMQKGDGTPTISSAEQIEQTANAIAAMAMAHT